MLTGTTNIGTTYSWTGPNGFTSSSLSPTISAATTAASGTYTVTMTLGSCSSTATTVATVNPSVTGATAASSATTVCNGNTANLTSSATNQVSAAGYILNGNSGVSFVDISTSGTSVGTISDDSEHNITLPSAFNYNGVSYTTARVGNNGVLVFGDRKSVV